MNQHVSMTYLRFIKTMTRHADGSTYVDTHRYCCSTSNMLEPTSILERVGVFNVYFQLSGLHSRGDFVQAMIRNMDYTKYLAPTAVGWMAC